MKEQQRILRVFLPANLNSGLRGIHCSGESSVLGDIGQRHHAVIVWNQDYVYRGQVKELSLKTEERDKQYVTLSWSLSNRKKSLFFFNFILQEYNVSLKKNGEGAHFSCGRNQSFL